jgi:hypothetical protein
MSTSPQEGSQPTVVLVHGDFVDGSGWRAFTASRRTTTASESSRILRFHSRAMSPRPR